jgi:hypothetical protein
MKNIFEFNLIVYLFMNFLLRFDYLVDWDLSKNGRQFRLRDRILGETLENDIQNNFRNFLKYPISSFIKYSFDTIRELNNLITQYAMPRVRKMSGKIISLQGVCVLSVGSAVISWGEGEYKNDKTMYTMSIPITRNKFTFSMLQKKEEILYIIYSRDIINQNCSETFSYDEYSIEKRQFYNSDTITDYSF